MSTNFESELVAGKKINLISTIWHSSGFGKKKTVKRGFTEGIIQNIFQHIHLSFYRYIFILFWTHLPIKILLLSESSDLRKHMLGL